MPFSEGAFQRHLNTIAANRQGYSSGFRPGTQTLDGRKFDEDRRQFDLTLADTQQARKADALRQALKFKEKKRQFDLTHDLARQETDYAISKPYSTTTTTKPGNNELFADVLDSMLQGQNKHRQAILKGEDRNPHNYNYYLGEGFTLAQMAGQPLSLEEIKQLREQADKLSTADRIWQENLPLQNEKKKPWWRLW